MPATIILSKVPKIKPFLFERCRWSDMEGKIVITLTEIIGTQLQINDLIESATMLFRESKLGRGYIGQDVGYEAEAREEIKYLATLVK